MQSYIKTSANCYRTTHGNRLTMLLDTIKEFKLYLSEKGYSGSTQISYVSWVKKFIAHHKFLSKTDLLIDKDKKVKQYIKSIGDDLKKNGSRRRQAVFALSLFYKKIIGVKIAHKEEKLFVPSSTERKQVISDINVEILMGMLNEKHSLIVSLIRTSGIRLQDVVKMQVEDVDFTNGYIRVKKHYVPLLDSLKPSLQKEIEKSIQIKKSDRRKGFIYKTNYIFYGKDVPKKYDPSRGYLCQTGVQKAIKEASEACGSNISCSDLRRLFARNLHEMGININKIHTILGHKDARTTRNLIWK